MSYTVKQRARVRRPHTKARMMSRRVVRSFFMRVLYPIFVRMSRGLTEKLLGS